MLSIVTRFFYLMSFPLISMFLYENYTPQNSENWVSSLLPDLSSLTPLIILWAISIFGSIGSFHRKYFRILYSAALFLIIALTSGADFDHDLFAWFYISILFVFEGRSKEVDEKVLSLSKLTIVLIYFMSGFWKVFYSVGAIFNERLGYFHLGGLRKIIEESHLLLNHKWPMLESLPDFILLIVGILVIILEMSGFFLYIKKRPSLNIWGFGIIAFHLLTVLTMRVEFVSNMILIGIVFLSFERESSQSLDLYTEE